MIAPARWEFATSGRILFGVGVAREAAAIVASLGSRVLVVTGVTPPGAAWLEDDLTSQGVAWELFVVDSEPDVAIVRRGAEVVRGRKLTVVVALGGGSAIDAGKAIAALATNDGDPYDYLEVVGRGQALNAAPLPFVAIPTTSGTGAEVTRNAVLAVPEHRVKVSLRSPLMLPRVAIVDPALTYDLPPAITAFTGLDALTQNVEPFLSRRATPLTDALCHEGIRRAARSLRPACEDGRNADAREDLSVASLCGGLALANAGLGAVHGLAGPIGGMFTAPHGAVCAALLPAAFAANIEALAVRAPGHPALARADEVARLLTGVATATARDGAMWLAALVRDLGVPPLSHWGIAVADISAIVDQAARSSSMAGNPIALTNEELTAVVTAATDPHDSGSISRR